MSGALDGDPVPRWAQVAAVGVALTVSVELIGSAPARAASATPAPSATARVSVTTTSTTVHAAGSSLPDWGLIFLIAVFVAAVAVALPATRHRGTGDS